MHLVKGTRRDGSCQAATRRRFNVLPRSIADDPSLKPSHKAILLCLAGYAWGTRSEAWPSNQRIAEAIGLEIGHTRRLIRQLLAERPDLVTRTRHRPDEANRTGRTFALAWKVQGVGAGAQEGWALALDRPSALAPTELNELSQSEKSSSSKQAELRPDDNDRASLREPGKQGGSVEAAVVAARRDFPSKPELARMIEADARRIERKVSGRWDAVVAAVAMAACRKTPPSNPWGWILTTAVDYARNGIPHEAQEAIRKREAWEAGRVARKLPARPQEPQPAPDVTATELETLTEMAANTRHPFHRVAVKRLTEIAEANVRVRLEA